MDLIDKLDLKTTPKAISSQISITTGKFDGIYRYNSNKL